MTSAKRHLTLEQVPSTSEQGKVAYLVTETRNTIHYEIGTLLSAREICDLAQIRIEYTVKGAKR